MSEKFRVESVEQCIFSRVEIKGETYERHGKDKWLQEMDCSLECVPFHMEKPLEEAYQKYILEEFNDYRTHEQNTFLGIKGLYE